VPSDAEHGVMSMSTLHNAMNQVVNYAKGRRITFIWHGGEPLLLDLKFYQEVAEVSRTLRDRGHSIRNAIQTNGTLVTDALLDFITKERDFRLGLSLDGPEVVNDFSRPKADGSGSFKQILQTITAIREREARAQDVSIGSGVICIIGRHNIKHLDALYDFFKSHQINFKVNPLVMAGRATCSLAVTPMEYGEAMCRLFDLWIDDPNTIRIDPFQEIMTSLISGTPSSCNFSDSCAKTFVSIGPLGDIYPCGRFDGMSEFRLGNVNDPDGLKMALSSPEHAKLGSRGKFLSGGGGSCSGCQYLPICNGGCMHIAHISGDVMGKDPFCAMYKSLYGHISKKLHAALAKAENIQ